MNENTYKLLSVALLCTTIAAGAMAVYYNFQLNTLRGDYDAVLGELEDFTILVDIMVDFGDDSVEWYNDTRVQIGSNVLDAAVLACDAEYQTSEFGAFVTSIGGVAMDSESFWLWSMYEDGWEVGMIGADQQVIHDGDIIGWTFTSFYEG